MKAKDIISSVAVILCIAAAAWLPGLGVLFTLAGAVVCGLLYLRCGWYPIAVCAVLGFAAAFGLTHSALAAVVIMIGVVLPGCAMMVVWRKQMGMREIVTAGTVGFLVQMMLEFGIVRMQTGNNIFSEMLSSMQTEINSILPQLRETLEAAGAANVEESLQAIDQMYHYLLETVAQLIPAILFVCCCVMAYIVLCCCAVFLRRGGQDTNKITPFTQLHAPRSVALAVVVTFAISIFAPQQIIRGVALNITMVLFAYFVVCGISLLCFFMKRWFPRTLLRILIAIPMVFTLLSMMVLPICNPMQLFLLTGIVDSAFGFRRLARRTDVF